MAMTTTKTTDADGFSSGYIRSLSGVDLKRYQQKIDLCCGIDPYEIITSELSEDWKFWPKVEHTDIVNYLVLTTNSLTCDQMKAYKSLQAHTYFTSGFVNNLILTMSLPNGNVLLLGKVGHSQSLKSPFLKVWILFKITGEVITAHCLCMAGRGEVCSHVGALLFAIETGVRLRDSVSCTEQKNVWLPARSKNIPFQRVQNLNFSSAKKRKKILDTTFEKAPTCSNNATLSVQCNASRPTEEELAGFFKDLHECGSRAAILRVVSPYCKTTEPDKRNSALLFASELFQKANRNLSWEELLQLSNQTLCNMKVTPENAQKVEEVTKLQSKTKLWFQARTGRITASVMKSACRTDPCNPSISLIKEICYPLETKFENEATRWGLANEKTARKLYEENQKPCHEKLVVSNSGFHIYLTFPFIGASPDGLVSCQCCGSGVCEIKCPFRHKESSLKAVCEDKSSCLTLVEGVPQLKHTHEFYYQIQTQIHVCDVQFCDFILYTTMEMHIERIYPDKVFWDEVCLKAKKFYEVGILPELLARWHTSPPNLAEILVPNLVQTLTFCLCNKAFDSGMIPCHNENCVYKFFHLSCLKLKHKPRGKKWMCPNCR